MDRRTRRGFLGASVLAGIAGCLGTDGRDGDGSAGPSTANGTGGTGDDGQSTSATATPTLVRDSADVTFDHTSATGINDQPTLGDRGWEGVIVAFEDPSCPTCRRFHRNTYPQIRSDLVATGDVAYVLRGYPVIYEWGGPATQALEAVYDRDRRAVWGLLDFYFDRQSEFSTDAVLDRTRQFLNGSTEVDGDAVVADVEADAFADAVQTDFDAGQAAGASGTPTFYLFRDGEYQTTISGAQDFQIFENVLTG